MTPRNVSTRWNGMRPAPTSFTRPTQDLRLTSPRGGHAHERHRRGTGQAGHHPLRSRPLHPLPQLRAGPIQMCSSPTWRANGSIPMRFPLRWKWRSTARICPSGAIRYERLDGQPGEPAPLVNTVRIREDGPLAFNAPLRIAGEDQGLRATLCRCGLSKNKPYCDNSHKAANFTATGEPPTTESQPLSIRGGPLTIAPETNGPLRITGSLELCSGDQSNNRPPVQGCPVPVRAVGEQALLRREPQARGVRGALRRAGLRFCLARDVSAETSRSGHIATVRKPGQRRGQSANVSRRSETA